ncbi:HNH endonuclease [Neobacillus vireti]|uniref:HNH endonuclease n=1 Tax=Neobacillus vireti TaxID=220686 RepID=UPI003000C57A
MESPYRREYHRAIVRQRTENGKNKQWQQENPDRMRGYRIKREMHKTHTISNREWEDCKKYFNHRCAYCGLKIEEHFTKYKGVEKLGDFHKEHVDHSGANDLSNCVPACRTCNSLKNVFELEDWYNKMNDNFDQDRLEKIHKWLNEDYLKYIEKVGKIN